MACQFTIGKGRMERTHHRTVGRDSLSIKNKYTKRDKHFKAFLVT